MSSLADKIRSRHQETGGEVLAAAETLEGSESAAPNHGAPSLSFANLPQLRTVKSNAGLTRGFVSPPKWGPSMQAPQGSPFGSSQGNAGAALSSPPSSSSSSVSSGPQIAKNQKVVASVTLDVPESKSVVVDAVREVAKQCDVQIEIAKSVSPRHATFMIKGNSPECLSRARVQLELNLQPQEETEVIIPSSARASLIGPRGSSLRNLEAKYRVNVELSNIPSEDNWSFERTLVSVKGPSSAVSQARDAVIATVDASRVLASTRSLPGDTAQLLKQHEEFGSGVNVGKRRVTIQGTFDEIIAKMATVDNILLQIENEFVRKPINAKKDNLKIPSELVRDVYEAFGALVLTETHEVWGPAGTVEGAVNRVSEFLNTQTSAQLDIAQAHGRDGSHARMLARYFSTKGEIERISKESNGAQISEPLIDQNKVVYTITGEEKAVQRARIALKSTVNAHGPASISVVRGMRHPIVRNQAAEKLKGLTGPIFGIIGPSDELYLEYREPDDDFAAQEDDILKLMEEARKQLSPLTDLANSLIKKKVIVDEQDAKYAFKPFGPQATELWNEVIGNQKGEVEIVAPSDDDNEELESNKAIVILNGTKNAVNAAAEALPSIISHSKQHAIRASFVEEIQIDPEFVRNLIGRNGSQIQKFRNTHDVKIEVDEAGHVRIQGVNNQVKACVKDIGDFQRRLRDEVTENLQIPTVYHAKLIGPKGKHVRRLGEQHQCIIKFPKSRGSSSESGATAETENPDDEDAIMIRGPSRGVAAIKREFLDLVNYERAQSYTETMTVPGSIVSHLVGRGGVGVNSIRMNTGASIEVGTAEKDDDQVEIVVKGEQRVVKAALSQLQKSAEAALDFSEKTLEVPQKYHRLLNGPQNSRRRALVAEAGGDPENATKLLFVPPLSSSRDPNQIRISGPSAVVNKLEKLVLNIISAAERQSQVEGKLDVPRSRLRRVVGPEGSKVREIEEKYSVLIDIPRGKENDDRLVTISLTGETPKKVEEAIDYLREVALPEVLKTKISKSAWNSRLRSQVASKFKASLTVQGNDKHIQERFPTKPADASHLIQSSDEIEIEIATKTAEEGKKVVDFITKAASYDTDGYLWVLPEQIPIIVGTGGKNINGIRKSSQCLIDVPHNGTGSPIVVNGTKANVEAAIQALLQSINQ